MPNYPSPPGNRFAYDIDGSQGVQSLAGVVTRLDISRLEIWNDESNTEYPLAGFGQPGIPAGVCEFGVIFPEQRTIEGICLIGHHDTATTDDALIQTSPDSTNLQDGVWTSRFNAGFDPTLVPTTDVAKSYRSLIVPVTWANVKAIRAHTNSSSGAGNWAIQALHIYGFVQVPPYLQIWDPALNQEVDPAYFDWGDIPQSSNDIRTFRVHNFSAQEATNIILSFNALTPGTPDATTWHYLSLDGINYFNTVNIGALASGFTSGLIYVQRITPDNAQLALGAVRLVASATFV